MSFNRNAVILAALLGLGCMAVTVGCRNNNLFGRIHESGEGSDVASLNADAMAALRARDYSRALNLYNRALNLDPRNSEALYGSAVALMGTTGVNVAQILVNISKNAGASASGSDYSDAAGIFRANSQLIAGTFTPAQLAALDAVLDQVICRLLRITKGINDGKIKPDDLDVLINVGAVSLLRGAIRPYQADFYDIQTNSNGQFTVIHKVSSTTIAGSNAALVERAGRDIAAGYALWNAAVNALVARGANTDSGSYRTISRIRDSVNTVGVQMLTPYNATTNPNGLDSSVITLLNGVGLSSATFTNFSDATTVGTPPGCNL